MTHIGKRLLAATAVLGLAAVFLGTGVSLSTADEPKVADLSDLRDAVKSALKRGENVDEVKKALDVLEAAVAKGLTPQPGKEPPAELTALRNAVEAAARKGENVEEIRKQLDAVEKKFVGRVLVAPKAAPPPITDPNARPDPPLRRFPNDFPALPPRIEFPPVPPVGGFGGGIDRDALQKAMELRTKALELLLKNPEDPEALKLAQQATEMMLKAIGGGRGGIAMPELLFPDALGGARVPDRFRLGVRMERLTPIVVEQLGIEPRRGIAITDVIAGSAAEKAGFKVHDIVLEFGGKPVSDAPEDFSRLVGEFKAGAKLDAVVLRKGKKVELKGIELPEAGAGRVAPPVLRPAIPDIKLAPRPVPMFPNTLPDLGPKPGVLPGFGDGLPNAFENRRGAPAGNGNFTAKLEQNGVKFSVEGTIENGTRKLREVVIEDNGKVTKADSLEKVPEEYRPAVEKLLQGPGNRRER
jgi:HEPN domain-containing protein